MACNVKKRKQSKDSIERFQFVEILVKLVVEKQNYGFTRKDFETFLVENNVKAKSKKRQNEDFVDNKDNDFSTTVQKAAQDYAIFLYRKGKGLNKKYFVDNESAKLAFLPEKITTKFIIHSSSLRGKTRREKRKKNSNENILQVLNFIKESNCKIKNQNDIFNQNQIENLNQNLNQQLVVYQNYQDILKNAWLQNIPSFILWNCIKITDKRLIEYSFQEKIFFVDFFLMNDFLIKDCKTETLKGITWKHLDFYWKSLHEKYTILETQNEQIFEYFKAIQSSFKFLYFIQKSNLASYWSLCEKFRNNIFISEKHILEICPFSIL